MYGQLLRIEVRRTNRLAKECTEAEAGEGVNKRLVLGARGRCNIAQDRQLERGEKH